MNDEKFEKIDQVLRERLRTVSRPEVPDEILKDFSASVAEKIKEEEMKKLAAAVAAPRFRFWRAAAPVFAVWALFAVAVSRIPLGSPIAVMTPMVVSASEIAEELDLLKAVGAWTDEDDQKVVPDETVLERMESSGGVLRSG